MVGVLGYGCYITRVAPDRCADDDDQDFVTLAVEAARRALARSGVPQAERYLGAIYLGTRGRLQDDQPGAAIVGEALGAPLRCHCADVHSGAKSGAEAIFAVCNLVKPSTIEFGLAIAADAFETPAAAASASAFLFGRQQTDMLATVDVETGRRPPRPEEPAPPARGDVPLAQDEVVHSPAFEAVSQIVRELMARKRLRASDFAHAILQQPEDDFPPQVGDALGFSAAQLNGGRLTPPLSPAQAAFAPTCLTALLDEAATGDRLLMCAYGANVGADAYVLTATQRCAQRPADFETAAVQARRALSRNRHA